MGFRNPFRFCVDPTDRLGLPGRLRPGRGRADHPTAGPRAWSSSTSSSRPATTAGRSATATTSPTRLQPRHRRRRREVQLQRAGQQLAQQHRPDHAPGRAHRDLVRLRRAARLPGDGHSGGSAPGRARLPVRREQPVGHEFPAYYDQAPFFYEWSRNRMWEFRVGQDGKLLKAGTLICS